MTTRLEPVDWTPYINRSSETVPPFGVVKSFGAVDKTTGCVDGYKPDTDDEPGLIVNGETSVGPGLVGKGTHDNRVWVSYSESDGAPVAGDEWGVAAGSWVIRKGRRGFKAITTGIGGRVNAFRVSTSSTLSTASSMWGWLAGLSPLCCLLVQVDDARGRCSCIDRTQQLVLRFDTFTGRWESDKDFAYCNGTAYQLFFQIVKGQPFLFDANNYYFVPDVGAPDVGYFTGGLLQCNPPAQPVCLDPNENVFRLKLTPFLTCPQKPGSGSSGGGSGVFGHFVQTWPPGPPFPPPPPPVTPACCSGGTVPGRLFLTLGTGTGGLVDFSGSSWAVDVTGSGPSSTTWTGYLSVPGPGGGLGCLSRVCFGATLTVACTTFADPDTGAPRYMWAADIDTFPRDSGVFTPGVPPAEFIFSGSVIQATPFTPCSPVLQSFMIYGQGGAFGATPPQCPGGNNRWVCGSIPATVTS